MDAAALVATDRDSGVGRLVRVDPDDHRHGAPPGRGGRDRGGTPDCDGRARSSCEPHRGEALARRSSVGSQVAGATGRHFVSDPARDLRTLRSHRSVHQKSQSGTYEIAGSTDLGVLSSRRNHSTTTGSLSRNTQNGSPASARIIPEISRQNMEWARRQSAASVKPSPSSLATSSPTSSSGNIRTLVVSINP